MAVSWVPRPPGSLPEAPELPALAENALELFPSERQAPPPQQPAPAARARRSGVTMRVAPISLGVALGLAATFLAGAGSVAAIGLLVLRRAR